MSLPGKVQVFQNILDGRHPALNRLIDTSTIKDSDLDNDHLSVFDHSRPLGISPGYLPSGELVSLAIADDTNCRVVEFQDTEKMPRRGKGNPKPQLSPASIRGRTLLQDLILCRPTGDLFAFDMGPLAMALYSCLNLRITQAVDIQSAFSAVDRKPITAIKDAIGELGDSVRKINAENIKTLFLKPVYDFEDTVRNRVTDLAMRAWISQLLPNLDNGETTFEKVKRIDTQKLPPQRLNVIAKVGNDALRLDSMKPVQNMHRIQQKVDPVTGELVLASQDYHNKLRQGSNQTLIMNVVGAHGSMSVRSEVGNVEGKAGHIFNGSGVDRKLTEKKITTVISIGRDDPTTAEAQRAATVLRILQGSEALLDESPWIQNIWFPETNSGLLTWPKDWSAGEPPKPQPDFQLPKLVLNPSQQKAVNTMLSETDDHRVTIIQGPPGTGKTSVIAAFVNIHVKMFGRRGIWLVAASNVAVKNIAEKLIKTNFTSWRLLVSKDFQYDWHDHLYTKIKDYTIRSDKFLSSVGKNKLKDVHVILCTLSMLSNSQIKSFTLQIPLKTLVVDEASQIEIGNYVSVFSKFQTTLRKACFIGDNKQLPPYGQEDLQDLQSIFEVPHLQKQVLFLDTQYRMPPQIGRIISKAVYDNKLQSNPLHEITNNITACYFMDVGIGKEQQLSTGSFKNELECQAVLQLAGKLQEQNKLFKIITPYAGQTTYIEESLKEQGLDFNDKCFNVDSFQGNEEDYIIISIVRSRSLGFLTNLRRTNVMLSRCKKGMFIVSSQQFLTGPGEETLVGQFLKEMEPAVWLNSKDIENGNF